jgi:hypothetical protein
MRNFHEKLSNLISRFWLPFSLAYGLSSWDHIVLKGADYFQSLCTVFPSTML